MPEAANPYEIFLGQKIDPDKPDFVKIFGIDPKKCTAESITVAADKVIAKVRAQKPGDKAKEWAMLIDVLTKAKKKLVAKVTQAKVTKDKDKQSKTENRKKTSAAQPPASQPPASQPSPAKGVDTYSPPANTPPKPEKNAHPKSADDKANAATPPSSVPPSSVPPKPSAEPANEKTSGKKSLGENKQKEKPKASSEKQAKPNPASPPSALPPKASNKKASKANGKDDMSFTLDAPDREDSFDSDTHLSTNTFNSPGSNTAGATAPTVDPMAAVNDPTQDWESYDISHIDDNGFIAGGTAVATAAPKTSTEADSPAALAEKTFYSQSYKQKSKVGLIIGGTLLAMLIVGGISYGVIFGFRGGDDEKVADNSEDKNDEKDKEQDEDTEPKKEEEKDNSNEESSGPKKIGDPINDTPEKNEDTDPEKDKSGDMKDTPNKSMDDDEKNKTETPNPNTPDSNDPPKKDTDDTEMKKEDPMDLPQPKNSDIAQLAQLMTDARQKLNDRNMVDATRLIDKAKSLPILPDHKVMLDRLAQINDLYNQFWNKVVEGCGKLKGLDEIKFSETNIIKVVESSEEKIIYRALGQRFEKAPRELQLGIAMKIAEKEMDMESAEGRMIKGAVFAIDAVNNDDRVLEAKNIWEEAKLVGGETDELILFLDDSYEDMLASVIKKEKVPDEKTSAEAQDRFKEKYADDLKTAGRNQTTSTDFAKLLLKDVPSLDDPADRHANFVAAIFYAGKFGDVELTMKAISDMNKWFSIEMENQTLDALTKMNKGRLKPDQKREIMRTAFEFMDRAKTDSKPEHELKFAELALAAARGARDPKLVATATRELARVKASQADQNN